MGRESGTALGKFLALVAWDRFCTLTFRNDPTTAIVRREFNRWMRRINMFARQEVGYFWVIEQGNAGGRTHLYVLTCFTQIISPSEMARVWYSGRADVREYTHNGRAAQYVAKMCGNDETEFDLSPSYVLSLQGESRDRCRAVARPTKVVQEEFLKNRERTFTQITGDLV